MEQAAKRREVKRPAKSFAGGFSGDALIRTPCGDRRAEMVRPGDLIVTRNDGLKPVRMVWKRTLTQSDMDAKTGRAPVRLKPRAIGPMMPRRDLLVAPDHRILVPGYRLAGEDDRQSCLVAAAEFAQASDEVYVDRNTCGVDLYTFIFDSHQVFTASGLPVESFLPSQATIPALAGQLRNDLMSLFPRLSNDPDAYPAANFRVLQAGVSLAKPA